MHDPTMVRGANGELIDYEMAVQLMDDELREDVHSYMAPCTQQEFYDEYARRYEETFGMEFCIDY